MSESNPDADVRYDDWPIESAGAYADWTVERATPRDEDVTDALAEEYEREVDADVEWVGAASSTPYVYVPSESSLYEADLDREAERVVLREADHEVGEGSSLAERIEELGEAHGWEWLSSFAREHLESEGRSAEPAVERGGSEFQRRNVARDADHDVAFFGTHRFVDASGREHVIERRFRVDESGDVAVESDYLLTDPDDESEAELVAERERTLDAGVDADAEDWEHRVESVLREWHDEHAGWARTGESAE